MEWCENSQTFIQINYTELMRYLEELSVPAPLIKSVRFYPPVEPDGGMSVEQVAKQQNQTWLIVPGVSFGAARQKITVSDITSRAQELNLKTAIVFYASHWLHCKKNSANGDKKNHIEYMEQIAHANRVIAGSEFVLNDLLDSISSIPQMADVMDSRATALPLLCED